MPIVYALEPELSAAEFRAILIASTLGERRPVDDPGRLDRMLREADVIVTARNGSASWGSRDGAASVLLDAAKKGLIDAYTSVREKIRSMATHFSPGAAQGSAR